MGEQMGLRLGPKNVSPFRPYRTFQLAKLKAPEHLIIPCVARQNSRNSVGVERGGKLRVEDSLSAEVVPAHPL